MENQEFAPKVPADEAGQRLNLPSLQTTLLVRSAGDPRALLPSIRAAVHEIDPLLPVFAVRTMDEAVAAQHRNSALFRDASSADFPFLRCFSLLWVCM
jgi:hypothetical protein